LEQFESQLQKTQYRLAVFDHISSVPALILPVKKMVEICRKYNVESLVDGAHAVGQVHLDLSDMNPDYYTSNIHKWLLGPKGTAFLYVAKDKQISIHPTVITDSFTTGFQNEFEYTGTRDYCAFLTIPAVLEWRKSLTDEAVWNWNNNLCTQASDYLTSLWNSSNPAPKSMFASLVNVAIPCNTMGPSCYTWDIGTLNTILKLQYEIWTVLYEFEGKRYVRLSCQVFNELSDYKKLGDAIVKETNPMGYFSTHLF